MSKWIDNLGDIEPKYLYGAGAFLLVTTFMACAKLTNIFSCSWLRYAPDEEETTEAYETLLDTQTQNGRSVADAINLFERSATTAAAASSAQPQETEEPSSLFGLFRRKKEPEPKNKRTGSLRISPSEEPKCIACTQKIFPTEESTTAKQRLYHTRCFKCSECGTKLKNHPDEEHRVLANDTIFLQCSRCKLDGEQKYKEKTLSRLAGKKIEVGDEEQGDIDQVIDDIGDELEEKMHLMIPRCAICGGDFLQYAGEISIVGVMKYHKECLLMGRPAMGLQPSMTLQPLQAAKYLPDNLILRLSVQSGKIMSTLYFLWKDKENELKMMRSERKESVTVHFELDENARANPNFTGSARRKTTVPLPPPDGGNTMILDLVGGDQISPQPPQMIEPVAILSAYQNSPYLAAGISYFKYNLQHKIFLSVPCNVSCDELQLSGATLTVEIQKKGRK
jgi:hypothetical protein